jgi:hypothetical protein
MLAQGSTPTIASDDFGNIGVAYSTGNQIFYVYRTVSGSWSSPFQITSIYGGREPSITGFGNKMYLTWAGNEVYFTSFVTAIPAVAANPENVTLHVICSTANYRFPSIAVVNSGGSEPVVRVAYYSHLASCSNPSVGVYVVQRPTGGALTWAGFATGSFSEFYSPVNPSVSSVSLAANRLSGEFYLLYCFLPSAGVRGLWKIGFAHGDTTTNIWNRVDYFGGDLTTPVIADVTAITSYTGGGGTATGLFKTAYSASGYGTVVLKNGSWTGAIPTFSMGLPKSYAGRNPHVIDFSFNDPVTGEYKGINLIYEYSGSGYYELRTDYFNWFLMF